MRDNHRFLQSEFYIFYTVSFLPSLQQGNLALRSSNLSSDAICPNTPSDKGIAKGDNAPEAQKVARSLLFRLAKSVQVDRIGKNHQKAGSYE